MRSYLSIAWIGLLPLTGIAQNGSADTLMVAAPPVQSVVLQDQQLPDAPLMPSIPRGQRYQFKLKAEIPATVAGIGLFLYGMDKNKGKNGIDTSVLNHLDPNSVNEFDRSATDNYSEKAADLSDLIFWSGYPLPLLFLLDRDMRKEIHEIYFMYVEVMTITGMGWSLTSGLIDRYRPYTYNPNAPLEERTRGFSRNSFIGGHPSATAAVTLFMARIYTDYHPNSGFRYVLWGIAPVATLTNAYLRYKGGLHFPSDLAIGMAVGTASGLLIPKWHRTAAAKGLSISPVWGEEKGLALRYRF